MNEKLKMQQRDNELERLVHELEMKVLSHESVQAEQEAQDSRYVQSSQLELLFEKQTMIQKSFPMSTQ